MQEGVYHYRAYLEIANHHSSWGTITVAAPVTTPVAPTPQPSVVHIPDPNLRAVIQERIGNQITTNTMLNLTHLYAPDRGITSLTGLERATNLRELDIWSNSISDVSPLAGLTRLTRLDIQHNSLSDISPLAGLTQLTYLDLRENPLNAAAINTHIPAIQANGTQVFFDNRAPTTPQPQVANTPQPNVPSTPQPDVVSTPKPTRPAAGLIYRFKIVGAAERSGATVNEALDSPLLVQVVDLYDDGISNVRVFFQITAGKGRITSRGNGRAIRVRTDSDGYARTDFTPTAEGTTTVKASISELNKPVEFTIRTGATLVTPVTTPPPPNVAPTSQPTGVVTTGRQPAIYWVAWSAGKIQHLEGSNVTDLVTGLDEPKGIAVDVSGGKIYWVSSEWNTTTSAWVGGKIQSADLDGSNIQDLVTGLDDPQGIALDIAGGKMYWTSQRGMNRATNTFTGKIQCADLDGSNIQDLVTGLEPPRGGIALDVARGKMYWTDWSKIQCADLDGSNVRTLVPDLYNLSGGIAVDVVGGKIYWIDLDPEHEGRSGIIQCADLDGSNVRDLVTGLDDTRGGIALDVARGQNVLDKCET